MDKVLVTGGNGWIGRYVVPILLELGYEVHATYRRTPLLHIPCTWHQADLLRTEEAEELMMKVKPARLLHLAWEAVPPECYRAPANYAWVKASMGLIESFAGYGGQRVVVAGTCAEYRWANGYLSESSTPLTYATPYAACKNRFRSWLDSYSADTGLSWGWGRIFHLYGPHDPGNRLISAIIYSLLSKEEVRCTHGNQYRDFLHAADAADALVRLLLSDVEGTVNIASGESVQVKKLAALIEDSIGEQGRIRFGAIPFPKGEPLFVGAHTGRLRRELCWQPKFTLEEGLEATIAWWRKHPGLSK
ncbi:NAD-dependent epimerase/dehydratase family protein [Paenibacillus rigui]|uniref:CDP-4-dehydro-6-deoxy-D-gulose 4-reductase n=1 Tax=Paenibacillus rigui TaxID=554312 RepID=A0A229ULR0_9BACL|nr:NAD(P)-dependent oxidoreductase [Paenibacillus rigui]OXM84346.1 CDP-4-dehydro-6-deoxy-D-gulose 4-reductase [Paenibacillus rigui]